MKSIGPYWAQMSSIGLRSDEGMSVVGWWGLLMYSRGHYGSIILGAEPFRLWRAHSGWVGSSWDHGGLVGLSAQLCRFQSRFQPLKLRWKRYIEIISVFCASKLCEEKYVKTMFIFYPLKLRWTKYVEETSIFQLSKIIHRKNVKWRWFLANQNYVKASTSKRLQFFVHCNYIKKYVKMTWKFFDIFFLMHGSNILTLIQCSVSIGMYTMLHKTASQNLSDFNLGHFFLYSSPILFVIRSFMIEKIFYWVFLLEYTRNVLYVTYQS